MHDIYREWRQVFNEYNPPRFAVGEAWVKAESQHLYASTDELGQVFNFEFAEATGSPTSSVRPLLTACAPPRKRTVPPRRGL